MLFKYLQVEGGMAKGWGWFLEGFRVGLEVDWAGAQRSDVEGRGQTQRPVRP